MRLKLSRFRRNFNKDLPIEFTEQNLSSFGGLELFSRYLRRVELSRRIGKACRGKGIRSDYGSVRLVLVLVGMLLVGARRLEHLQYVCDDPMLLRFCGLRRLPSRPTIVNWLKQFTGERLKGLSELNGVLVHEQIERLGLNRLTVDMDGTVVQAGNQVGWAFRGFNPHRKKNKSFYPLFAHLAQTGQILKSRNRPGNVHDSKGADAFLRELEQTASGLAAVWARENSRASIYDALERKETYATTGSRIMVRFFAGWDFTEEDALGRSPAFAGYAKGVPMAGDLSDAPGGEAPSFLVAALKDPLSGNLDRIQIIKGWMDSQRQLHERVYDVAVSDGRQIGPDGRCKTPVGYTVDIERATWSNTIGDSELITVWEDPEFDPEQRAFYYARVIEIPTPRWTAYEAARFGIQMPDEVPMTTQERAYTSPIWYTP